MRVLLRVFPYFSKLDWVLNIAVFFLLAFSLASLYGLNLSLYQDSFLLFKKQILFIAVGLVLMFIISLWDYRILKNYTRLLYILAILLLIAVLLIGQSLRGVKGWFSLGFFTFQPVELVKLISIIFLAHYFTEWARMINQLKHIVISGLGVFILFFLVILQPDFGSSIVLFLVWFFLTMVIGIQRRHLLLMLALFLLMGGFLWQFVFKDYQKDRILAFLNPSAEPLGRGYQLTQSMVAVGGGGIYGKGLGAGSQSQLKFLPESPTDFIFASLAEELGLIGVSFLLGFYIIIFYRLFKAVRNARDDFGVFLVLGIFAALFVQMFINIGMNIGVMPITGISLPFVSYGGSYLLITLIMIGLAQAVIARSKSAIGVDEN